MDLYSVIELMMSHIQCPNNKRAFLYSTIRHEIIDDESRNKMIELFDRISDQHCLPRYATIAG